MSAPTKYTGVGRRTTVKHLSFSDPTMTATSATLRKMGMPAHLEGYRYLTIMIAHLVKYPRPQGYKLKELWPLVEDGYHTTYVRAEKNTRCAINECMERMPVELYMEIFEMQDDLQPGKISTKVFVNCVAEYIISHSVIHPKTVCDAIANFYPKTLVHIIGINGKEHKRFLAEEAEEIMALTDLMPVEINRYEEGYKELWLTCFPRCESWEIWHNTFGVPQIDDAPIDV